MNRAVSSRCEIGRRGRPSRPLRRRSSSGRKSRGRSRRARSAGRRRGSARLTRSKPMFSGRMPAAAKRSRTWLLVAPGHRADEAFRRRRRVGGADLQDLRDQRRVARDPVAHDDPAAGLGDATVSRERRRTACGANIAPKTLTTRSKLLVGDALEVGGVALLETEVVEPGRLGAFIARSDEVGGNVDAKHVGAEFRRPEARSCRRRSRGRAPSCPGWMPKVVDEILAALAHRLGDAGEVALFPERPVRIDRSEFRGPPF